MPRGQYGRSHQPTATPSDTLVVSGAESELLPGDAGGASNWKAAALTAAALTGVVVLGAATTSFTGRRRRGHARSPYRSMY